MNYGASEALIISMPLPPPWRKEEEGGEIIYFNEISGERTRSHPFLACFANQQSDQTQRREDELVADGQEGSSLDHPVDNIEHLMPSLLEREEDQDSLLESKPAKQVLFEYHCQWNERDVFGKVTLYGLTIRVNPLDSSHTFIRFDGMDGQWEYVALKGPHGSLELHDLFIGAKVTVFGRHLTISSANLAAVQWVEKEHKRLLKQQDIFRRKIENVGQVPVVRKSDAQSVKHITRDAKIKGQVNLRAVLKDNAKLGEQLANLGLASRV